MAVEYRVKKITRYIVTRYEDARIDLTPGTVKAGIPSTVSQIGEYPSNETAFSVAYALCKQEHHASGEEPGSMNFIYPTALESDPA